MEVIKDLFNPIGTETGILREIWVNIIAGLALASCVEQSAAAAMLFMV